LGKNVQTFLCSDSYALPLFEKNRFVTEPVRMTSFPTFPSGIEKWTIPSLSIFENQFTFLDFGKTWTF
jgi:hypothetical protein